MRLKKPNPRYADADRSNVHFDYKIELTKAEERYYDAMETINNETQYDEYGNDVTKYETICVGASLGGGFTHTSELHVMTYDQAMATEDKDKWYDAVEAEHGKMKDSEVFRPEYIKDIPEWATVLSTTWAMKKKSNGTHRARMVARGFEQIDGEHYDKDDKSAPVVCDITIRVVFVLMLMAGYWAELLDIVGAFLLGTFRPEHRMYIEVPKGFERFYPPGTVLLLLKTLYGTRQAALQFWRVTCEAFRSSKMQYERSKADACLWFKWTKDGIVIWITWVDDCLIVGPKNQVLKAKEAMKSIFKCDDNGPMKEYVGCKVERDWKNRSLTLTQPVILQSFKDEFKLPGKKPVTPAPAGDVLRKAENEEEELDPDQQKTYRTGTGKLLHVTRWTRPECMNRIRELSRFMAAATLAHLVAMHRVMEFCLNSPNRGWTLKPDTTWDGSKDFLFTVSGKSDSDYATDPDTRHSVSGMMTFLNGACVAARSRSQKCVTLSVTEAEFVAATECAQDMLYVMRVLESMGLQVQKPMVLEVDNKGAVDLANNWSSGGRARHVATRIAFLRELKEEGLLIVRWTSSANMTADILTKNVGGADFVKHSECFVQEPKLHTFDVTEAYEHGEMEE